MGKREQQAAAIRSRVLDVSIAAFDRDGYEATTMESIAAASGVAVATLYRHFPTKESILVSTAAPAIRRIGDLLEERPDDEPLADSFGIVLDRWVTETAPSSDLARRIYRQLMCEPVPHGATMRLWERERRRLADEIRRRLGAGPRELWVELTAHTVVMIYTVVLEHLTEGMDAASAHRSLRTVTALLAAPAVVLPRFGALPEEAGQEDGETESTIQV